VLRHICLFRLRGTLDEALLDRLGGYERRCLAEFPDVAAYRFSRNVSRKGAAYPLVLYGEFGDEAAFTRYVASPFHDDIAAFLAPLVEETLVADVLI
jgi:hypothetical protein